MKQIISILSLFIGLNITAQKNNPQIIVGIVIDQMCYDYLYRFQKNYSKKGFKEIMKNGTNCRNVEYNYIPTYTGPGHASIYSGTTPNNHGIVANNWYERNSKQLVNCVGDLSFQSVGTDSDYGKCSPNRMKSFTVTDQLKLTYPDSKVISLSIKDRGAILPGGHKSDGSYWFDYQSGKFITSSYFRSKLPEWLTSFNENKNCFTYAKRWIPILEEQDYSSEDKSDYEVILSGKTNSQFPYDIEKLMSINNNLSAFTVSPFANTLLTDLAIEAIQNEDLGEGEKTDMICISYSSTDIAGHAFGPYSKEIEDMYIRLDLDISRLIKFLNKKYGKKGYVLFMTADHGVVPVPKQLSDLNLPGGYVFLDSLEQKLKEKSKLAFGADLIEKNINLNIYLNHERIDSLQIEIKDVESLIKNEVIRINGVKNVLTADLFSNFRSTDDKYETLVIKGFDSKRSGDLLIILEPGYLPETSTDPNLNRGTSHGSGYAYDTHVPLLWYGSGIKKQEIYRPIEITDIAPTLTHILNIQRTGGMTGNPIVEILEK